jgi:hypothetical protein
MFERMLVAAVLFATFTIPALAHDNNHREHENRGYQHEEGLKLPFGMFRQEQNQYCYDRYGNPYECDE